MRERAVLFIRLVTGHRAGYVMKQEGQLGQLGRTVLCQRRVAIDSMYGMELVSCKKRLFFFFIRHMIIRSKYVDV